MKDDDARSGEERPLLAAVEGESGQDAGEAPPIAGQDGGCVAVDGKVQRAISHRWSPDRASCAPGDGPVLFSIEGGKWVPGGSFVVETPDQQQPRRTRSIRRCVSGLLTWWYCLRLSG